MSPQINLTDLRGSAMTIHVHVTRRLRWRIAVAVWLIRLAGRVLGSHVAIRDGECEYCGTSARPVCPSCLMSAEDDTVPDPEPIL